MSLVSLLSALPFLMSFPILLAYATCLSNVSYTLVTHKAWAETTPSSVHLRGRVVPEQGF